MRVSERLAHMWPRLAETRMRPMTTIIDQIAELKLIPMVVIDDATHAEPFGDALVEGGLPIAEITFRTAAAESAIRSLAKRGDVLVGAGTVLTTEQAIAILAVALPLLGLLKGQDTIKKEQATKADVQALEAKHEELSTRLQDGSK